MHDQHDSQEVCQNCTVASSSFWIFVGHVTPLSNSGVGNLNSCKWKHGDCSWLMQRRWRLGSQSTWSL